MNLEVLTDTCCVKSWTMTGFLKESVSIYCGYPEEYKTKWKYLYKLKGHSTDEVIYVHAGQSYENNSFSIYDDTHSNVFIVSIHNLAEVDGGVYLCGVYIHISYISTLTTVQLHVTDKVGSARVTVCPGDRAIIRCKQSTDRSKSKFICKESHGECAEKMFTKVPDEWHKNRVFSLYDDTSGGSLMVFIKDPSEKNYRCGVDESQFNDQYTEVKIEVKGDFLLGEDYLRCWLYR
ncbi:uncharacterized protein LOC113591738 [Electrophorus electricus]|uniref:uncharacterized protein LOC113591738 n=1 Tax=Electrophorus electricus TaxID=8005 RepID=UPI0015D06A1E|nr:uncharacterized protein LOC113591738 [Electrophorus electricus]